ncbi:MAG: hypothetical protein WC455_11585 [Dehalococcoidia bacterium]|jgi:hypothetical protein
MSKHMAGQWRIETREPDNRDIRFKRRYWRIGGGPENKGVAFVFGEDEANAHLIAAAPDLLEACRAMLEPLSDDGDRGQYTWVRPTSRPGDHEFICNYCQEQGSHPNAISHLDNCPVLQMKEAVNKAEEGGQDAK